MYSEYRGQRPAKQKISPTIVALERHRMSDHHRKMIGYSLEQMRFLEGQIGKLDEDIVAKIKEAGLEREWQLGCSLSGIVAREEQEQSHDRRQSFGCETL